MLQELEHSYNIRYRLIYPGYSLKSITRFALTYFEVLFFRRKESAIVFQKLYSKGIYTLLLKFLLRIRPKRTYYDIDDAEYVKFEPSTIHYFMKRCSATIVASSALEEYSKHYSQRVEHLTSPVIHHNAQKKERNKIFTVGWIGWHGIYHKQALEDLIFPAIQSLNFKCRLVVLGVYKEDERIAMMRQFQQFDHVELNIPMNINWLDEEGVYSQIVDFDVSVAPLLDNEIHRAKSAFKLKQCFSCGVPGLASPIGENNAFLIEGINGFFCSTPKEFAERIEQIKSMDKNAYQQLSANALMLFDEFSMKCYGSKLKATLES